MATAQLEKGKEVLACTVCADTYSDPCTLMCQHSFCRNCITKYIKTKPEALRTKTIPCPSCHQVTKVPDPIKPVEQWASQIKPQGSGRRCNAREKQGETTPATSCCTECEMALCDRCTKLHQTSSASRDHEVCDLSAEVKVSVDTPLRYDNINVRTREDKKNPSCMDITTLVFNNVEVIIVTDEKNDCVKSFYTKNGQWCYSRLPLDDYPQGLSNLKENQVVVTVPTSNQIITVKACPELILLSTLETNKRYYSVVVLNGSSMAVGCTASSCVDILNMSGQVMRSVSTHKNVKLFSSPSYLCASNKGNIFVSDGGENTVTCFTSEGDVLWQYAPTGDRKLQRPRGITTDTEGNIFLADYTATKVIQLTERGQFVKEILTGGVDFMKPRGLTCHKPGKLLVCDGNNFEEFTWI